MHSAWVSAFSCHWDSLTWLYTTNLNLSRSRQHQRRLPIASPPAAMAPSTTPGAAGKVESRPAADQGLPKSLQTSPTRRIRWPWGPGKRLRQRLHRLGRKIEGVVITFKDIPRDSGAQLEGGTAATATATVTIKGPRPKNAERRRKQQAQKAAGCRDSWR